MTEEEFQESMELEIVASASRVERMVGLWRLAYSVLVFKRLLNSMMSKVISLFKKARRMNR